MEIIFPHCRVSDTEYLNYCVCPAQRLRQSSWEQLQKLDGEYRQYESEIRNEIVMDR
jgi:hypothetical protein